MAKPTRNMTGVNGPRESLDWADGPAEEIGAGAILGGKYRLISEIGRGGMGSVWRAEHVGWDAPVALKLMNRDITAHPEAIARFEREVRLAAGLRSPHVVQVLDHGVDEETHTPFIAMELLEGESLARRLKRACLSPAEAFDVFSQLVRALSRAHAAGIVHRDLKPDNVFLVRNEEESLVKVLDFGVAKWMAPDLVESGLTRPGSVVGTPFYMSPEQIQGSREIDHRADLWALAAIACECLTGRRPFEAPDFAQLAVLLVGNIRRPLPSSLGVVPPGFDAWFLRATDPDINRRFQSAREMAQALAPLCDVAPSSGGEVFGSSRPAFTRHDVPSMAPMSHTAYALPEPLWRRPLAKLVGATVAATLVTVGAVGYWVASREPASSATPASPLSGSQTSGSQTSGSQTSGSQTSGSQTLTGSSPGAPRTVSSQPSPSHPPKGSGPGIRPISPSSEPPAIGFDAERVTEHAVEADSQPARPPSASADGDGFDRAAAERRVRASLLARPRATTGAKPRRPRATRDTPRAPVPVAERAPATYREKSQDESPGEPPSSPPPASPRRPSAETGTQVDGRRIRTSL